MTALLTRAKVAKELGRTPNTIWRWEKGQKSPVKPKKIKYNGQVRYTQEDLERLRKWMAEVEEAGDVDTDE